MRERDHPGEERHYYEHPSQYPQDIPALEMQERGQKEGSHLHHEGK